MDYLDAAEFIFDLRRFRMKPGTDATQELLSFLGNPERGPRYIQVAGSNGKGSTAKMIESILRESGLQVGLYTSPHMEDMRDRIQVDGRSIPESAVVEFVSAVKEYVIEHAAVGESPTFFEVLTAMAFWYFGRQDVDVAVIEVGIGGQYDATSAVDPEVSALTSVALEHTELLGDTIEEIARDKAAVAPRDGVLVTGASGEALHTIRGEVSSLVVVGESGEECDIRVEYAGVVNGVEGKVQFAGHAGDFTSLIGLVGAHQARNAGIAIGVVHEICDVSQANIKQGLRSVRWPGRFEIMEQEPLVVLDGAHNPAACSELRDVMREFEFDELYLVFGAMHDKNHSKMVNALPRPVVAVACQPDLDRAEDRDVLREVFEQHDIAQVEDFYSVERAVDYAVNEAGSTDCVLVTGSLYTVGEARVRWSRIQIEKKVTDIPSSRSVLTDAHVTDNGVWRMRGKGVHRVVKAKLQPRQARIVKEEMLSLGGECAVSGLIDQEEELVDVVIMGTLFQLNRLVAKLKNQPFGLKVVGKALWETVRDSNNSGTEQHHWEAEPVIMGILNVTPDSFYDGNEYADTATAVSRAEQMIEEGASIIDIGGESTRPGASPVSVTEEINRIIPVIEQVSSMDTTVSVDTRKAAVAEHAIEAGASLINDVSGLGDPEMRFVAAKHDVPLVIMHSIETPVNPDRTITYNDVVEDCIRSLRDQVLKAEQAGVPRSNIIVDPGLGFGKTAEENFQILSRLNEFHALQCPVLVGHSHKSMFEHLGYGPADRSECTIAASAIAADRGADIIRVHDIKENVAALQTIQAINELTY